LDGQLLRKWYFPSKYGFQNFNMEEYIEMQAERFKTRPVHPCVKLFQETLQRIGSMDSSKIQSFIESEQKKESLTNKEAQILSDLKALFELVKNEEVGQKISDVPADEEEISFLLETLRVHVGAEKAVEIAAKVSQAEISLQAARKMILELLKTPGKSKEVDQMNIEYTEAEKKILSRRHRFIDPLQRRRRLKWMERLLQGKHSAQELKHHSYYKTHPDKLDVYPSNMGPATIKWPSPYQ
jgi:hypothetical protein